METRIYHHGEHGEHEGFKTDFISQTPNFSAPNSKSSSMVKKLS